MSNNNLYINGSYIQSGQINANLITSGTIASANNITTLNLTSGNIVIKQSETGGQIEFTSGGIEYKNSSDHTLLDISSWGLVTCYGTQNRFCGISSHGVDIGNASSSATIRANSTFDKILISELQCEHIYAELSNNTVIEMHPITLNINNMDITFFGYVAP